MKANKQDREVINEYKIAGHLALPIVHNNWTGIEGTEDQRLLSDFLASVKGDLVLDGTKGMEFCACQVTNFKANCVTFIELA